MPAPRVSTVRRSNAARLQQDQPLAPLLPTVPEADKPISLPQTVGAWRVFAFVLAFAEPSLGLGLALLYWPSADARAKRFSRWCLGLALLGLLFEGGSKAVGSGLSSGDWLIQPY